MRLPDSKTGAKTIYLSAAALAVLVSCGPREVGLVVPGLRPGRPQSHPFKVLRRLARAAGIALFCARMSQAHVCLDRRDAGAVVAGGTDAGTEWATTQRYAHLAPDPVEQATELVGEALRKALGLGLRGKLTQNSAKSGVRQFGLNRRRRSHKIYLFLSCKDSKLRAS